MSEGDAPLHVFTVGHWMHPMGEFLALLHRNGVREVIDVRSFPGSRRSPWFSEQSMPTWLGRDHVRYTRSGVLGGRRRKNLFVDPTRNTGWDNESFKNYADYLNTSVGRGGVDALLLRLRDLRRLNYPVAIMCGEPVPWRCHRSILSDHLALRGGASVLHILPSSDTMGHEPGKWGATPSLDTFGDVDYPDPNMLEGF